jgi:hypothetical protein
MIEVDEFLVDEYSPYVVGRQMIEVNKFLVDEYSPYVVGRRIFAICSRSMNVRHL